MVHSYGNTFFDDVTGDVWTSGDDECEPFEPDVPDESDDFEDYDEDGGELVNFGKGGESNGF